jgi:hypothetical protein
MDRGQRGDGSTPRPVRSPRCRRRGPVSRSRAGQRAQAGQRGHHASCQFQAQKRRRNCANPPGAPPAIMQASRIARPAHAHSAAAAPPHAPAADRELHQRVPAGAQPQDGSPDRAFHLTGPSPDTSATSTLPPRVPRGTGSKVPGNSSPKASGLPPMPWRPGTARHGTASRPSLPTTFRLAVPLRPLPAAALPAITHRRWAHKAPRYVPCAPPSARTDDQYRSAGVCASPK